GADILSGGGNLYIQADNQVLNGTTNAGSGRATLRQSSPGVLINLGGADAAATLGLTAAELNSVTAAVLEVGSVTSGNMSVTAAIAPTGAPVLALTTGGTPTHTARAH